MKIVVFGNQIEAALKHLFRLGSSRPPRLDWAGLGEDLKGQASDEELLVRAPPSLRRVLRSMMTLTTTGALLDDGNVVVPGVFGFTHPAVSRRSSVPQTISSPVLPQNTAKAFHGVLADERAEAAVERGLRLRRGLHLHRLLRRTVQ